MEKMAEDEKREELGRESSGREGRKKMDGEGEKFNSRKWEELTMDLLFVFLFDLKVACFAVSLF